MDLEDKLNKALKEQEKESYKARRNKHAIVAKRWNNILPWNYYKVISSFSEENLDTLFRCLSVQAKEEIWNYISNSQLAVILGENESLTSEIFWQMSDQRKWNLLNDEKQISICCGIFFKAEFPKQLKIMEMFSVENLSEFFRQLTDKGEEEFFDFLQKLYLIEDNEEQKKTIFSKIAILPAKFLARIFQEADADVVCQILQHMKEEAKPELCRNFHGNVYELFEKTDFALLNYIEEFPEWNFDAEEMQDFFYNLEEREINIQKYLSVETILAIYCVATDSKIKEKILFNFTEMLDKKDLYERLSTKDKIEMLEIMVDQKTAGQYDKEKRQYILESAIYILEEKEKSGDKLTYFEELVLKDLKA